MQVGHGEFVTEWPASSKASKNSSRALQVLMPATAASWEAAAAAVNSGQQQQQKQHHAVWLQELLAYCRDLANDGPNPRLSRQVAA
jgi:hypothetical protein